MLLYNECTGRAIALPLLALMATSALKKCLNFKFFIFFLCDDQGAVRQAIPYVDRSCYLACMKVQKAIIVTLASVGVAL